MFAVEYQNIGSSDALGGQLHHWPNQIDQLAHHELSLSIWSSSESSKGQWRDVGESQESGREMHGEVLESARELPENCKEAAGQSLELPESY